MFYLLFQLVRLYAYAMIWMLVASVLLVWGVLWCVGRIIVLAVESGQKRQIAYPPINTPVETYRASRL